MKQMTKDELIEYFIEQLGDNEILGQFMTINDIKEKLKYMIEDIIYSNIEQSNWTGSMRMCQSGRVIITIDNQKLNLNFDEMTFNQTLVHELIHVLTTYGNQMIAKIGVNIRFTSEDLNKSILYNVALNEGITDDIAMKITNMKYKVGYSEERDLYKLMSTIIGEDNILKIFTDSNAEKYFQNAPYDIFYDTIILKYGEKLGKDINECVKKILAISDEIYILSNFDNKRENGQKLKQQLESERHTAYKDLFKECINREGDILEKINIMKKCIGTSINKEISEEVINELVDIKDISFEEKIEIIKKIREEKGSYIPNGAIEKLFFSSNKKNRMSIDERLSNYFYLHEGEWDDKAYEIVYQAYVDSGRIIEDNFLKNEIFSLVVPQENMISIENVDNVLKKITYQKIGNYYKLNTDSIWSNGQFFNENNQIVHTKYFAYRDLQKGNSKIFEGDFFETNADKISLQLKNLYDKQKYADMIAVFGNMIRIRPINFQGEKKQEEYYSIDQDGMLHKEEIRGKT